jgi:hypothetical protein
MTATNHALTGALIGLIIGEPLLALPAALVSHFICDALPHYSSKTASEKLLKTNRFRNYLIAEAALCGLLVLILALARPEHWLLACFCAFIAASPDFLWLPRYLKIRAGRKWKPTLFSVFAAKIQWFQRPIGAAVETAWFITSLILLLPFLR